MAIWVGIQFYMWVRFYETLGRTVKVSRPPGVEAWLPIAALMNTKDFLLTRTVPEMHPAGMFMLIAFLAISFLFRRAFCAAVSPFALAAGIVILFLGVVFFAQGAGYWHTHLPEDTYRELIPNAANYAHPR